MADDRVIAEEKEKCYKVVTCSIVQYSKVPEALTLRALTLGFLKFFRKLTAKNTTKLGN